MKESCFNKTVVPNADGGYAKVASKRSRSMLRLTGVRPFNFSPDKAKVTLKVDLGGTSSDDIGYQMYLDSDSDTYGVFFPTDLLTWVPEGEIPADTLEQFEHVIPENASGNPADRLWVGNGDSSSMEIEPGVYDYVIATLFDLSRDGSGTWVNVAQGDGLQVGDDFVFAAGCEYVFTVAIIDEGWGSWESVLLSLAAPVDMSLTAIHYPQTGENLGQEESVGVTLKNWGMEPISSFQVFYRIDNSDKVEETVNLPEPLAYGDSLHYEFEVKADLSRGGWHALEAGVEAAGDGLDLNNVLSTRIFNAMPLQVPVNYAFETEENFNEWRVLDANGDSYAWTWNNPGDELYNGMQAGNNDWLVCRAPVSLPSGPAFVHFNYRSSSYQPESLEVLYGRSPDTGSMTRLLLLDDFLASGKTFQAINFDVTEADDDYYFAFRACSDEGFILDLFDIVIDTGVFVGVPGLALPSMVMPASVCGLGTAEPVEVSVWNTGTADIHRFELVCSVNGENPVSRVFNDTIPMGMTRTFTLNLDFSEEADYEVSVTGRVLQADGGNPEPDTVLEDNVITGNVTHFSPARLPYAANMDLEEERGQWYVEGEAWYYDGYYEYAMGARGIGALVSRCMTLEEGKSYRIGYHMKAGMVLFSAYYDSYSVLVGMTGTARDTWDTLAVYRDVYTNEDYSLEELVFDCPATGSYSVAFVPDREPWNLYLRDFSVAEISEHDVRIANFASSAIGLSTPAHFAAHPAFDVRVENRGFADEHSVTVSILRDGTVIGESAGALLQVDSARTFAVEGRMSEPSIGDTVALELRASLAQPDQNQADNSMVFSFVATDTVFAFDTIQGAPLDGLGMEGYAMGNLFSIPEADTLTSVRVNWFDMAWMADYYGYPDSMTVVLAIYPVEPGTGEVGTPLLEQEYVRYLAGGLRDVDIPALYLRAGSYLIALRQTGEYLMGVGYDQNPSGLFYIVDNDRIIPMTGNGNLGIRAIFGHDGKLLGKDVSVTEITKPVMDEGLFAANESIEFVVKNWGTETVSVPVSLLVSGKLAGMDTVELEAYAETTVALEADLSLAGEMYGIKAFSSLEGDENTENDTCFRYVLSAEPLDPYVMDFEDCPDFAGDHFNPAWTSVDGDGEMIGGFSGYSFPAAMSPRGFFVFNPSATEPSMLEDYSGMIAPHGGERFGASFFLYYGGAVNDWLISPKLKLPSTGCSMEFYVKSLQAGENGRLEQYRVLYSETDAETGSFTAIGGLREAPAGDWEKVEVDLTEIAGKEGKEVYLAIQCLTENGAMFMIDDIRVTKPTANEAAANPASVLAIYPNPATEVVTVTSCGVSIRQVSILNLQGAEVYRSPGNLEVSEFRYNVSGLPSGLYFARVATGNGTALLKFVVR